LAIRSASASSLKVVTASTGPKITSWNTRMPSSRLSGSRIGAAEHDQGCTAVL
jgi:hypothetical protein